MPAVKLTSKSQKVLNGDFNLKIANLENEIKKCVIQFSKIKLLIINTIF